jgi:hypothetical protein
MNTLAIATHLNIAQTAIVRIEEWASVIFVVAKGVGARFVSKKINVEEKKMETKLNRAESIVEKLGYGKVWTGGNVVRVYFGKGYLEILESDIDCRKMNHAPAYYILRESGLLDCNTKWQSAGKPEACSARRTSCLNCGITNSILMGRGYCTDCHGECG